MDNINTRAIALDILLENEKNPGKSHIILRQALSKYQYLDKRDRAFIGKLTNGTIERRLELDYFINQISKTPVNKMKPVIRNIVRMSAYQAKYMDKIPESAICNEAVKLASKRGFSSLKGFVNAVTRNFIRELKNFEYPDKENNYIEYLSVKYSMPEFIINTILNSCGKYELETILAGFQKDSETYIRCNTLKISPSDLKSQLLNKGICVEDTFIEYAFKIKDYDYLMDIDEFVDGLFWIQDLSSIVEGMLVDPKDFEVVLDICAAPGGKTLNAAVKNVNAKIFSRDKSDLKIELIQDNIDRLGIRNVNIEVFDATITDETMIEKADIVIADVPCSGIGILGRKADIRYNLTEGQCDELVKLQREILKIAQKYVKTGGYLIFSTCTINRKENEENVQWLMENFGFKAVDISKELGMFEKESLENGYINILPGIDNMDGFFIAKLKK